MDESVLGRSNEVRSPPFDVAVIGGGVVGCAVLRALTLAGLKCLLLERGPDLLSGASKANSAILHTGFDVSTGTLEARLLHAGRTQYLKIRDQLGLPLLETDAVLIAWNEEQSRKLPAITNKARANGITTVRPLNADELRGFYPGISDSAVTALKVPGEYVVDPWSTPLAYALQALANGARIERLAEVKGAKHCDKAWCLSTPRGEFRAKLVINCAGNFGDVVESYVRPSPFKIKPRKGQFVVLDKTARRWVPSIVLPVPSEFTKGIVVTPTIFGNVLVGPTAEDQEEREQGSVDSVTLENLIGEAARIIPALADEPICGTFAGLRPAIEQKDYFIEAIPDKFWITVSGIRSTGLTAALGIADFVTNLVEQHFVRLVPVQDPLWPQLPNLAEHLPRDHQRPGRGDLVCLCELVTRDEVNAALSGPLPAGDMGGLRRRTRAGLGRCQGFNCMAELCSIANGKLLRPLPLPERNNVAI